MKKNLYMVAMVAGLAMASYNNAMAVSINYASAGGGMITFTGSGGFSFSASPNFVIQSGSALNDMGTVSGSFSIGAITTSGSTQSAPVTGSGNVTIIDGINTFSATLSWVDITQSGTGGNLNINGLANLTGITYGGSSADLLALKNAGTAADALSFQFVPAVSLTALKSGGQSQQTTFSGSIATVPDGGATVMLLGAALSAISLFRKKLIA